MSPIPPSTGVTGREPATGAPPGELLTDSGDPPAPRWTPIDDPGDPRIADYIGLTDVARRMRVEPELGFFVAEGELVIARAVDAGYPIRSVLLTLGWLERLAQAPGGRPQPPPPSLAHRLARLDVPVYVATPSVIDAVAGFHVHRGALAAFDRRPLPRFPAILADASRLLVLEEVTNPTNLGAILRSAAGLGMDAVVLSPTCADPLYRRSVRVSMGEALSLPYARPTRWPDALTEIAAAGFRLVGLTPAPDALPLNELRVDPAERVAVLLGAEGPGLSSGARDRCDVQVRIPMSRGVDSLNVAAAAAVACFAVRRPDGVR